MKCVEYNMGKFNVKVEYDIMPIRHIAVECPKCGKWFYGREITKDDLIEHTDILNAVFQCPLCNEEFGDKYWGKVDIPVIEESDYPGLYDGCLKRRETWE